MPYDLRGITYEALVDFVFDHPADDDGSLLPDWYWDACDRAADEERWFTPVCDPALQVAHLTRLFREAGDLPERFSSSQLSQGFTLVFSSAEELFMDPLFQASLPWADRAACLSALVDLYEQLFSWEPCRGTAYMLFDPLICGRFGYPRPRAGLPDDDVQSMSHLFGVLQRILAIPNRWCQHGALHGLGHLMHEGTEAVIDRFLASGQAADAEIEEYARQARTGVVQ